MRTTQNKDHKRGRFIFSAQGGPRRHLPAREHARLAADTLRIDGLVVQCRLGVHEWEQAAPQTVWVDLELAIDAAKAAAQDDVRAAVDYSALVAAVTQQAQGHSYRLLETMAEDIAALSLQRFKTAQVLVRVTKKALPGIGSAAVEIVRRYTGRVSSRGRHSSKTNR